MSTTEQIHHVLMHIENSYPHTQFDVKEIKPSIVNKETGFTYLFYAGVLSKVSHGVYKLNRDHGLTPHQIHQKALLYQTNRAKELKKDKEAAEIKAPVLFIPQPPIPGESVEEVKVMGEQEAISLLKGLGYKISKAVTQYQEI